MSRKSKYNMEILTREALLYHTRWQFKLGSPRHYEAARRYKLLNSVCSHMCPIRLNFGQRICKYILDSLLKSEGTYNDRTIIPPYELDIFYKMYSVAVEYQGKYWHEFDSVARKDEIKKGLCLDHNIHLIHIYDEEREIPNIINSIKNQLYDSISNIPHIKELVCDIEGIEVDVDYIFSTTSLSMVENEIKKFTSLKDFSICRPGMYDCLRKMNRMDLLEHLRERMSPIKWQKMTDDEIIQYIKNAQFISYTEFNKNETFRTIVKRRNLRDKVKELYP